MEQAVLTPVVKATSPSPSLLMKVLVGGHAIKHMYNASFFVLLPEIQATWGLSNIEVGTLSSEDVRMSVIADNWLHLRGYVFSPLGQAIKAQIRAAFYPDSDDWRNLCYPRAVEIQQQALAGLAA